MDAHAFDTSNYAEGLVEYDEAIAMRRERLSQGKGDLQAICRQAAQFSLWNACIALILAGDVAQILRYFRQALDFALTEFRAPESRNGPRISIADYSTALQLAVCFGTRAEMEEIARFPEARYRNPNVIASEDYYADRRAWNHLLLREDGPAQQEMQRALTLGPNAAARPDMEAFVAVLDGDAPRFEARVEDRLAAHREHYQQQAADPDGAVCFPVLMLCRVAIDRGIATRGWPYVPLNLLPGDGAFRKR